MSADRHNRPSGKAEEPLTPPDLPKPSHAELARTLAAAVESGVLSTLSGRSAHAGTPYGSVVLFALDEAGAAPLFLISDLAEHTRNLRADARASLLIAEAPDDNNPLALARMTLTGTGHLVEGGDALESARNSFIARHPNAAFYADFGDFNFWRLDVTAVRYIGGFGRMSWVEGSAFVAAEPDPIAPESKAIVEHMNEDHRDALEAYAKVFTRLAPEDVGEVVMVSVDRLGFEMSVETPFGARPARIAFERPVKSAGQVRAAMVKLVKEARARLGA